MTKAVDARARMAARNNADLYEAVFEAHGLGYERTPYAFIGKDRPPPYYSNLTVLSDGYVDAIEADLRRLSAKFQGAVGLKDSFDQLDLTKYGFETLFSACWIWKEAGAGTAPAHWHVIQSPEELVLWEQAWKAAGSPTEKRLFNQALLARPDIFFLAKKGRETIEAGCIANLSDDCIGLSNVFSTMPFKEIFTEAATALTEIDDSLPIVGYEAGDDLALARRAGFDVTGNLRVLVAKSARFE